MTDLDAILARLPPRPVPPVKGECCGRGCEHCVWVYYQRAVERWEEAVMAIDPSLLPMLSSPR